MVFAFAAKFEMKAIESWIIRSFDVFAIFTSAGSFSEIIDVMVAKQTIRVKLAITFGQCHVLIESEDLVVTRHLHVIVFADCARRLLIAHLILVEGSRRFRRHPLGILVLCLELGSTAHSLSRHFVRCLLSLLHSGWVAGDVKSVFG